MNAAEKPRNAWRYFAGQRRVRRAPVLAYDTPIAASKGTRTFDDHDMWYGSPDRYEWKLLGKKEIYVPYNSYKLGDPGLKYADILQKGHINPDYTRYELHRVWVVEANLKKGNRHIYSRRLQYLDEDSWSICVTDRYDDRGNIWRCGVGHLVLFWDVPVTYYINEVHHDLLSKIYNAPTCMNEETNGIQFNLPAPDMSYFSAGALRRSGIR
jgi:Protein of unknown function (DUF1329)